MQLKVCPDYTIAVAVAYMWSIVASRIPSSRCVSCRYLLSPAAPSRQSRSAARACFGSRRYASTYCSLRLVLIVYLGVSHSVPFNFPGHYGVVQQDDDFPHHLEEPSAPLNVPPAAIMPMLMETGAQTGAHSDRGDRSSLRTNAYLHAPDNR